jgi:hypothetical protein
MKHRYHIITAFNRWQNLDAMIKMLQPLDIIWEPICDDTPENRARMPVRGWICARFAPKAPDHWHPAAWPIYWHPCRCPVESCDRYLIMTDDDGLEPGFLEKVDEVAGDFLIVSLKRGDHQPPTGPQYGTDTLIASPENFHHGRVAGEQLIVSGYIWRSFRHLHTADGDWPMMSAIASVYPPVFVPDAFAYFNYLEPGRWNKVDVPHKSE